MFYTYVEKQGRGLFSSWGMREMAFDTLRRYLYYSEPVQNEFSIVNSSTPVGVPNAPAGDGSSGVAGESVDARHSTAGNVLVGGAVLEVSLPPSSVTWRKKIKVTAVLPLGTTPDFDPQTCSSERDLYQLEIRGESRSMAPGEMPPAGPLLCPGADLSVFERSRCNVNNDAYIRDPFFLKELFDSLRDQFEELGKQRVRAAMVESGDNPAGVTSNVVAAAGTQTLLSPRGPKGQLLQGGAVIPVRLIFRSRDEREFRRLWFVLQSVLGYDKLSVRPYRGLPPYDPRNGIAFAHIPMSVWGIFHSLDKAVFYTFIRGNLFALEDTAGDASADAAASPHASSTSDTRLGVPRLRCILEGAYLCITSDSVLFMRRNGNIPRWLRLAEVHEFYFNLVARDAIKNTPTPFCAFLSDAPIPDLLFGPLPPAQGRDAVAAHTPLVDIRRITSVIHDSCFSSLATRRVIRIRETRDASMEAYVARIAQAGQRLPILQRGAGYNSTLSCPLPKEQLAAVWQQVQSELLELGNMTNRAAIPIYASNAGVVDLSEDQLSTVERELDERRERLDDIVGMPLDRAKQLERRHRGSVAVAARTNTSRRRYYDATTGTRGGLAGAAASTSAARARASGATSLARTTMVGLVPLTMDLLQTPQIRDRPTIGTPHEQVVLATRCGEESVASSGSSSRDDSMAPQSEDSSYSVPGARYISQDEWQSGKYAIAGSMSAPVSTADKGRPPTSTLVGGGEAWAERTGEEQPLHGSSEERTVSEIIERSMAALKVDCVGPP